MEEMRFIVPEKLNKLMTTDNYKSNNIEIGVNDMTYVR